MSIICSVGGFGQRFGHHGTIVRLKLLIIGKWKWSGCRDLGVLWLDIKKQRS